jgi:hypothetical protein
VTGLLGKFDAFIDGGAGGDSIEMKYLKCAELERDQDFRFKPCVGVFEQRLELVVEANLPAEDAEDKRCGQIAVRCGKSIDSFAAEQIVRMGLAALNGHEDVEGGFSCGGDF